MDSTNVELADLSATLDKLILAKNDAPGGRKGRRANTGDELEKLQSDLVADALSLITAPLSQEFVPTLYLSGDEIIKLRKLHTLLDRVLAKSSTADSVQSDMSLYVAFDEAVKALNPSLTGYPDESTDGRAAAAEEEEEGGSIALRRSKRIAARPTLNLNEEDDEDEEDDALTDLIDSGSSLEDNDSDDNFEAWRNDDEEMEEGEEDWFGNLFDDSKEDQRKSDNFEAWRNDDEEMEEGEQEWFGNPFDDSEEDKGKSDTVQPLALVKEEEFEEENMLQGLLEAAAE